MSDDGARSTAYPDIFNDVFGPIMQPGSSSHTAAPCRLGYLARHLLGERPRQIRVTLDREGSFAGTFGLMAEDSAMVAGALGLLPDDPDLFRARDLAAEAGVEVVFEFGAIEESAHPNAMKFELVGASGRGVSLVGDSTGGGMIETRAVDGFPLRLIGDDYAVLVRDPGERLDERELGAVAGAVSALVERRVARADGRGALHVFLSSSEPDLGRLRAVAGPVSVDLLPPVLPVLRVAERQPRLFDTMARWREVAAERDLPLWEVALDYEVRSSGWTRDRVLAQMREVARAMHRQTRAAYDEGTEVPQTPFRPDMAAQWAAHEASGRRLCDDLTASVVRWSYGAGAGIPGVPTVPGPMGSGGGYVYAALSAVREARGFSDDDLLRGLFVAAGVGVVAFARTEPTGEAIGCTGEAGICGAMTAAALVEMAGGTPDQAEHAASLSLQASIGMPCDPIPGGSSQPCRSRVLSTTCMAVVFADLALAGRSGVLPLHEVIDVADAVGRGLAPDLLCTSRGGLAATPTALERARAYRAWVERNEEEGGPRPPGNLI